jgi:hypothetical protein
LRLLIQEVRGVAIPIRKGLRSEIGNRPLRRHQCPIDFLIADSNSIRIDYPDHQGKEKLKRNLTGVGKATLAGHLSLPGDNLNLRRRLRHRRRGTDQRQRENGDDKYS